MNRIAALRKERGTSQSELAAALNTHQTAVSQWERGATFPKFEYVMGMSYFFDVSPDYLLGRSDERGSGRPVFNGDDVIALSDAVSAAEESMQSTKESVDGVLSRLSAQGKEVSQSVAEQVGRAFIELSASELETARTIMKQLSVLNPRGKKVAEERIKELTKIKDYTDTAEGHDENE